MKFEKEKKDLYKYKKYNHFITLENTIYLNDEFPLFGIVKLFPSDPNSIWGIVHLPTERVIISCFETKKDSEIYFEILSKQTDLCSLYLCQADFEKIELLIKCDVEIAYLKLKAGKNIGYNLNEFTSN